jgi:hypothetical protein
MTIIGVEKGRHPKPGEWFQFQNGTIQQMTDRPPFLDDPRHFTVLQVEEETVNHPEAARDPIIYVYTGERRFPYPLEYFTRSTPTLVQVPVCRYIPGDILVGQASDFLILRPASPGEYVRFTSVPVESLRALDIERLRLINRRKEQEMMDLRTRTELLKEIDRLNQEVINLNGLRAANNRLGVDLGVAQTCVVAYKDLEQHIREIYDHWNDKQSRPLFNLLTVIRSAFMTHMGVEFKPVQKPKRRS